MRFEFSEGFLGVKEDFFIRKSNDGHSHIFKDTGSIFIVAFLVSIIMNTSIDFDDQLKFVTVKISNKVSSGSIHIDRNGMLPAKLFAFAFSIP